MLLWQAVLVVIHWEVFTGKQEVLSAVGHYNLQDCAILIVQVPLCHLDQKFCLINRFVMPEHVIFIRL